MAPQQPDQPDLTSAQERAVRDLLADVRHTGPVPDDVAARLDAALADLATERAAGSTSTTTPGGTDDGQEAASDAAVVPIDRRRRRWIALGLVAAAAVVVGGVAVTEVAPRMAGEDSAPASDSGGAALEAGGGQDRGAQEDGVSALSRIPRLSPDTFRRDVLRVRGLAERGIVATGTTSGARSSEGQAEDESEAGRDRADGRSLRLTPQALVDRCGIDAGSGRLVVVRYAGKRALLVLRPPEGERQRVDLHPCGATEPLRTVVLPVR